jgi:hypothetical protein
MRAQHHGLLAPQSQRAHHRQLGPDVAVVLRGLVAPVPVQPHPEMLRLAHQARLPQPQRQSTQGAQDGPRQAPGPHWLHPTARRRSVAGGIWLRLGEREQDVGVPGAIQPQRLVLDLVAAGDVHA